MLRIPAFGLISTGLVRLTCLSRLRGGPLALQVRPTCQSADLTASTVFDDVTPRGELGLLRNESAGVGVRWSERSRGMNKRYVPPNRKENGHYANSPGEMNVDYLVPNNACLDYLCNSQQGYGYVNTLTS